MSNLERNIIRDTKKAIYDFNMIEDGETILLWVSGWKDSMLLWYILHTIRKHLKIKFEIRAVYVFKEFLINCDIQFEEKRKYFEDVLWIPLEKVNLKLPEDSLLNEWVGQSCQRCAYSRRIAFMKLCSKRNATKICFGHHLDDIVTTTFMNLSTGRNMKIMPPINRMYKWDIAFIRPFMYVREADIRKLCIEKEIPFSACSCPVWQDTLRNRIKGDLWEMEKKYPNFIENTFHGFLKDFVKKYKDKNYYID